MIAYYASETVPGIGNTTMKISKTDENLPLTEITLIKVILFLLNKKQSDQTNINKVEVGKEKTSKPEFKK